MKRSGLITVFVLGITWSCYAYPTYQIDIFQVLKIEIFERAVVIIPKGDLPISRK